MTPTRIAFETKYKDGSGVEFGISYDSEKASDDGWQGVIEFESVDTVEFPAHKIDWIIDCLNEIKKGAQPPESEHE